MRVRAQDSWFTCWNGGAEGTTVPIGQAGRIRSWFRSGAPHEGPGGEVLRTPALPVSAKAEGLRQKVAGCPCFGQKKGPAGFAGPCKHVSCLFDDERLPARRRA